MRPCRKAATPLKGVGSLLEWRAGMVPHPFHTAWGSDGALPGGECLQKGRRGVFKTLVFRFEQVDMAHVPDM